MAAKARKPAPRAFSFRAGIRLEGTHLVCDATSSASDLVFLSHAQALGHGRAATRHAGRHEILATDATLTLLGRAGERLRKHALPAAFGRPFTLGDLRLELFPAGYLPGAASLLVESGERKIVFAGTFRRPMPAFGAQPAEIRAAHAVCIDGTFGSPRFSFPPPQEALAAVVRFVQDAIAAGKTPVLLTPPFSTALDVAAALAEQGHPARGHRTIVEAAAAFTAAGVKAPAIARFSGKLTAGEVLLWPPSAREAPILGTVPSPAFAFVSGFSLDPESLARMRADAGIALSNQSGYPDLLAYVQATGATEVAVHRGFADQLAETLRERGHDAYSLGAPRQLELFRG